MAALQTGLGKGLDALIRETGEAKEPGVVQMLALNDLLPNPKQPRRQFSGQSLEELAASIRSQGVLQPLLVRPCGPGKAGKYEIVAGERRWRASQLAGLTEVPVLVRSFSAQDTMAATLIENLQREDLNPLEEALGIQALKEGFGLSQDDLAKKIGKSRSAIANSLRLLALPEATRKDLAEGRLSAGHARALLGISDPGAQERLKELILERRLSVREAEGLAAVWKESGQLDLGALIQNLTQGLEQVPEPASGEPLADAASLDGAALPASDAATAVPCADPSGNRKPMPQSARLLEVQSRISKALNASVRVTGKEDKGRISLSYNSREELEALLTRIAGPALESSALEEPTLEGQAPASLFADRQPVLEGRSLPSLDAAPREALDSARPFHLTGAADNPALPSAADKAGLSPADNPVLPEAVQPDKTEFPQ